MSKYNHTLFCFRCYHDWNGRKKELPKQCPNCRSPYWNKPRKRLSKDLLLKMKDMIISIHKAIIKRSGGEQGIRDDGGIYNSTYKLLNHQDKNRKNPTSIGAFCLNEFARRHYFVDGNKRTAYAVAKIFMLINRCHLVVEYEDALTFILEIARYDSNLDFTEIKKWLDDKCQVISERDIETYLKDILVNIIVRREENGKN